MPSSNSTTIGSRIEVGTVTTSTSTTDPSLMANVGPAEVVQWEQIDIGGDYTANTPTDIVIPANSMITDSYLMVTVASDATIPVVYWGFGDGEADLDSGALVNAVSVRRTDDGAVTLAILTALNSTGSQKRVYYRTLDGSATTGTAILVMKYLPGEHS